MKLRFAMALLAVLCLALSTTAIAQNVLFNDGPTNGQLNALFIDGPNPGPFQQSISDGFIATGSGTAANMQVGLWVPTGETPTALSWWIGTTAFGTDISSGSQTGFSNQFVTSNGYGYDVYTSTITGMSGSITAGNVYYLTLGNANDSSGDQFVAWDVSPGPASCFFAVGGIEQGDCGLGNPEGEAFTLNGSSPGTVPEPSSLLLLGSGVVGLAGFLRRKISL